MKLHCQSFELEASIDGLPTVRARFVVDVSPNDIDGIAAAFGKITLYLGSGIELVKASEEGQWRCFYCASVNFTATKCKSCGASK